MSAAAGVELGGRILEIGCYDGATAFQLALRLGADVVGSDLARYYVVQRPGRPSDEAVEHQQVALVELRERARRRRRRARQGEVRGGRHHRDRA